MKKIIDLHCDTLTATTEDGTPLKNPLYNNNCDMAFSKVPKGVNWAQMHAIFMPDRLRGNEAIDFYNEIKKSYFDQLKLFEDSVMQCSSSVDIESAWSDEKFASILTVEGGSVLAGNPERVKKIAKDGVKVMTLVWNGENEIGSGHNTEKGLSEFGKAVIPLMEDNGIIIDISHLNDRGFDDLLKVASKPFMATHSNARTVCSHKRNLTDDMIKELVKRNCLIGLNYYTAFISDTLTDGATVDYADMFYQHIRHFIDLGAEKNLALGSDFDGAQLPDCLSSPSKVIEMYEYLLKRGLSSDQLDDIYFRNALSFIRNNM